MLYFAAQTIKDLRMKVLICSLCLALCAISQLKAEEEPIVIIEDLTAKELQDRRSVSMIPDVSHDNRIIYVRLLWPCEDLQVKVEDSEGTALFSGTPDMRTDTEYVLEIEGTGVQTCFIRINVDERVYVGEFAVD